LWQASTKIRVSDYIIDYTGGNPTQMKTNIEHLKLGYWVAISIKDNTAPSRSYVGQIEAMDSSGIRLTLLDWVVMEPVGYDLFVPWNSLGAALVCTDEHDLHGFLGFEGAAARWQNKMNEEEYRTPT
jgi:hypothetical protein